MKKILQPYKHTLFIILFFLALGNSARANHLVGMDLFYTWVSGNTYKITLVAYGDCGAGPSSAFGALPTNTPRVYIYNGNIRIDSINLAIQPPAAGVEITPVCPAYTSLTQCTNLSYTIPGIKKYVYSANYTLPGTSTVWRFLFTGALLGSPSSTIAGRAVTITNLPTPPPVTVTELVDTLNNTVAPNSNPTFTNLPTPFFCVNNNNNYNPGAVDPNTDSLRFYLIAGKNGTATSTAGPAVAYMAPYSATWPLGVTWMAFDQQTGQISFYPDILQRSLVVYNVREFRGGTFVGSCQREMTFLVQTCTSLPPSGVLSGATAGIITDSTHFRICKDTGPFSLTIHPYTSPAGTNITVSATGLPSGLTFITTGNGTPTPTSTISWTSTGVAPGSYTFYVTYTGSTCPLSATQTIAYTITILSQPAITASVISASNCFRRSAVSMNASGGGAPWTIKVSRAVAPYDTIVTYPTVSGVVDSFMPGTYYATVFGSAGACQATTSFTVTAPTFTVPAPTFTNPTYCGASNGTIKFSGLTAGSFDSIRYFYNGVLQPILYLPAASDGTITITGLPAGVYSTITVKYGKYCVSSVLGPVTLVNPPFNMRAVTFVNPTWCGFCNGTIKLWGLRPGQVDTIFYTKSGIPQTPVIALIGADSTVTITGVCQGTYANFVAHAPMGCVSNTLGPVTLTVPPFTMRALSSTNPTYCGACNGTVKLYGLHPGQTDTIFYTRYGLAQPPVSFVVPADSTVTITGLCAGVYDGFTARTAGICISNSLGPVTLTTPPFTLRTVTSTNPSYCGICNGTIKLWGLHPGQTDTVTYRKGGVAQPPVIAVVGPDSTITITGLCAGTYDSIKAKTAGICISSVFGPITLTVPPFTMRALTFTNPPYCGICTGTIKLWGLYPGQVDTIYYKKNGVAQTPLVFTVAADSTITLTGLCAGLYDSFIARTGGVCVSNVLGPANLTVPPFTMRTLTFTNPDYCGICNGTIKLWGLYPGQVDSIYYTKNGIAQPPLVFTVASDSTITITGLCAGLYDNFVARTGGVCVSNTLGPANLTVPPFTMRALTFTNPPYCGICTGTITLYGLYPGQTDTISYTKNGVAQTPLVFVIGPDSTATFTGLCAGLYDNFIARTGGVCVSNTLGPANLTVPPFTMRALTFTHPTKCGWCDGTVKLYGLYPGQLDTIYFNRNGVPQTPVAATVAADSTILLTGLCDGLYTDFVARTGGVCVSNTLGPVTLVDPPIIPGYTYIVHEHCNGDTIMFTNTSTPAADLTYIWDFNDGTPTSTITNPTHVYTLPGSYVVTLRITNTKCFDSIKKTITLNNLVHAGFTNLPDSFACTGTPINFTNTSLGVQLDYKWYFGDGTTDTVKNPVHTYTKTGKYQVIMALSNYVPCRDTAYTTFEVDSISSVSVSATDSVFCKGHSSTFTGVYTNSGNEGIQWTFGDGSILQNINPINHSFDVPGVFMVRFDAFYRACPDTGATKKIVVFEHPPLSIGKDTAMCPGGSPIYLEDYVNKNNKNARWLWSTGETTPGITASAPGNYFATVTIDGCSGTDSLYIKDDCYMGIPNAFTPNGDGINDYFFPRPLLAQGLATFKMEIYNRWGEVIFATENIEGSGWDGKYNNIPQPQGVYVYIIEATFQDGEKEYHKGNITLIR
jgi:gliding motility-associated-like protein